MIDFAHKAPKRRRPSLTPMIDVVFLLLVFFMLASRFGADAGLPIPLATSGDGYSGPPRLVDILPEGVRLNGVLIADEALVSGVAELSNAPSDLIVLRGGEGAVLQRLVAITERLRGAGYRQLAVIE
ncbi:MAG: ExbD/TolR family protein [Paracoccaceae bacterium]